MQNHKSMIIMGIAVAALLLYVVPFNQLSALAEKGGNSAKGNSQGSGNHDNGSGNGDNSQGDHGKGEDGGNGKHCGHEKYENTKTRTAQEKIKTKDMGRKEITTTEKERKNKNK